MRNIPSCFGENGVQVADASCSTSSLGVSKPSQNSVTCIHYCKLLGKSCLISIIWSKNLIGQCVSLEINDLSHQCLCKADLKPSLFSKTKGSKYFEVNSSKVEIFWDLTLAKFGSGPEPFEGYYLAVVCKGEMVLVIGDLKKEAFKKSNAKPSYSSSLFISKREHIFGNRMLYGTKVQFFNNGQIHDLKIECQSIRNDDPCLVIRIDSKPVMKLDHLRWKFRGNYTILVDGLPVEVFWDVHNWLFSSTSFGKAVFVFQSLSAQMLWTSQKLSDVSKLPWLSPGSFEDSKLPDGLGFSLVLCVWKNE